MDWKSMLMHYQNYSDVEDDELLDEAIASCESIFSLMDKDKLLHHNRVLAMSYLALLYEREKREQSE